MVKLNVLRLGQIDALRAMTLGKRLALAFGMLLLLFAGVTGFAVYTVSDLDGKTQSAMKQSTLVAKKATQLNDAVKETYANMLALTMMTVKEDITTQVDVLEGSTKKYREVKKELMSLTHDGADVRGMKEVTRPDLG